MLDAVLEAASGLAELGVRRRSLAPPTRLAAKRRRVRDALREMITSGQLRPGTRLVQQELAAQLETSISVIRELLFELSNMGLVEMEENHGFVVGVFDLQRLSETYLVRAVHEGLAARLCCEKASRGDFRRLREMAARIVSLHETEQDNRRREAAALDRQFHAEFIHITGSQPLLRAWRTHWIPIYISAVKAAPGDRRYEISYREHLAIIEAIEHNHPEEAERLVREHILGGLEYLKQRFKSGEADMQWLA